MRNLLALLLFLCLPAVFLFPVPVSADQAGESSIDSEVFERSLRGQFPMTPEQIEQFRQRMSETKRATHKRKPPKMVNRTRRLSFETGKTPPNVRIAPGYVTTISFFDSTGQPWPITSAVLGNPNYYSVQRPENQKNIITVAALEEYVDSNLALTFKNQNMPATIQLTTVAEGEETDSLVVFRAGLRGPNARQPTIGPAPEPTVDSDLMAFLDNVPPGSARKIRLSSEAGDGKERRWDSPEDMILWSYQDTLYLRTKHPLLWPAWTAVVNGPGGVRVYELPPVSSLMVSRSGHSVTYDVKGDLYGRK